MAALAHHTFGDSSGGQRQRVLIARGLVQDGEFLPPDEPFSGSMFLRPRGSKTLISELAAEGRGIIIATHDLAQALCSDAVLLF